MKRLLLLFAIFFTLAGGFGASAQDMTNLEQMLGKINSKCPSSSGPGLTLTSVELNDKGVVMNFEVNEQTNSVDTLAEQKDMLHDVYVSEFVSTTDPGMKAMRQYSLAYGKPIIFHFAGNITDEAFDIVLTPVDLK